MKYNHFTKKLIAKLFFFAPVLLQAQVPDTLKTKHLDEVIITDALPQNEVTRLPEIEGTLIYAGKKNEVIKVSTIDGDLAANNTRQIFSKVPGVTIWENDGSGIQVSIATRGLSPNRSWEFNVRQNDCDISSEVFGYPEAYFSPPMEAVQQIEVVRGAASLQFGPQFGGLLNYKIKKGSATQPVSFETRQTYGSYGMFSSYNALGGTFRKISYYTYFHHRAAAGWRENSRYAINTGYASLSYTPNSKLSIALQYTRMNYESQQPGGLNDSLFGINAQQSFRSRNWMSTPWNVAAIHADYNFNQHTRLSVKLFGTMGERNSVGFTKGVNIADTFNVALNTYNPRQVDRDDYLNFGTEIRFLKSYSFLKQQSSVSAGVRAYRGKTARHQQGTGSSGNDYDITVTPVSSTKTWGRDLSFGTDNIAFFAENLFKIGKRLQVTPGFRFERIDATASGYINTSASGTIENKKQQRTIFLAGIGSEFKVSETSALYANLSQAYRPVTFSELTPSATTDVIDPNLKDASGYNLDFGYRGKLFKHVNFDIGGFLLHYNNRIGTITQNNLPFRTNIGTSVSKGVECFAEIDPIRMIRADSRIGFLRLYVSYAYVDARYTRWDNPAIVNDPDKTINGKRVEYAPEHINRIGATYSIKTVSVTWQLNKVSEIFTDAANTEKANITATTGKLPGYTVMDVSMSWMFAKNYRLSGGINNLSDEKYATRRAGGYPGPGLLPANGRNLYLSIGLKL